MLTQEELMAKWFKNKNAITWRFYLGLNNQILLNEAGCKSHERMTFLQAKQNGYRIKAWSKWVIIKYESYIPVEEKDSENNVVKKWTIPYFVHHQVFNLDQCVKINNSNSDGGSIPALDNENEVYGKNSLISDKQKQLLTKLVKSKYQDDTKREMLNQIPSLTKYQASARIKELLDN